MKTKEIFIIIDRRIASGNCLRHNGRICKPLVQLRAMLITGEINSDQYEEALKAWSNVAYTRIFLSWREILNELIS